VLIINWLHCILIFIIDVVIEEIRKWTYKESRELGSEYKYWGIERKHNWYNYKEEDKWNNEEIWD